MYKDNFKIYTSREVKIFKYFVENNSWFENQLEDFKPDNTSLHDLKCKMKNGNVLYSKMCRALLLIKTVLWISKHSKDLINIVVLSLFYRPKM